MKVTIVDQLRRAIEKCPETEYEIPNPCWAHTDAVGSMALNRREYGTAIERADC